MGLETMRSADDAIEHAKRREVAGMRQSRPPPRRSCWLGSIVLISIALLTLTRYVNALVWSSSLMRSWLIFPKLRGGRSSPARISR
jgi:hypothetical protein